MHNFVIHHPWLSAAWTAFILTAILILFLMAGRAFRIRTKASEIRERAGLATSVKQLRLIEQELLDFVWQECAFDWQYALLRGVWEFIMSRIREIEDVRP